MTRRSTWRRLLSAGTGLVLTTILAGAAAAAPGSRGSGASLAEIRAATSRFHDVNVALAEGYVPVSPCVAAPGLGTMGVHYLNFGLAADLGIDPLRPETLLYVPSGDGPRLVAVEYWSVALANTDGGPAPWFGENEPPGGFFNPAPSVLGSPMDGAMAGHDPQMPWHYDRHVWIWQGNPSGIFAQFNPKVSC